MNCDAIMKREVESVSPQDTVDYAARRMRDENIGFLPVCDENRKVLGALTDRDIAIRLVAGNKPASTSVVEIMTMQVVSCRPQDDIREAERLMVRNHKSRIMCIDDAGQLAGVISLSDIARHDGSDRVSTTLRGVTEREARV